jgi:RNA polymerase sigma-70 factor, ECF subfamily
MKSSEDHTLYDDETLIRLIVQSQEHALGQLYDRYHRRIFSLALAIVNDWGTAEEITLDVFMRVWQKAGTYRAEQAKVSTWLIHIARNHAIDVLRRRAAKVDRLAIHWEEFISHVESSGPDTQESAEVALPRERIYTALAQLPPEQKQALVLAYFGGYTQSQIAELLAQPLGTIKTRLRLALLKMREFLSQEQGDQATSFALESAYNINKKE